ncbi:Ankyrin repeat [Sesbania bispinosa]|nr:Ankyrin repeat [Sesbania bispinosa]
MASNINTQNYEKLKIAAERGDTNLLYMLIQEDPQVLEHEDSIQFAETPLHIAESFGHVQFATEIMRLKPSFALKLNKQGYSPIHIAMQEGQETMVFRSVEIHKDLVRIKGREGFTPLHLASQTGNVDLLAKFLHACPDSIEDVTVRNETALHIAVKNHKYESLLVLLTWLKRNWQGGAIGLENKILNWKDEDGNTILHIAALIDDSQALKLLIKTRIRLNAKNLRKLTALDIAASAAMKTTAIVQAKAGKVVMPERKLSASQ